jgi:catechol 2,3-dioxygenase-like lactoylglutathione lyase family enzyme
MMNMKYDAIAISSGQTGNPLCHNLADRGWTAALIEKEHLGGTCINTGCTPGMTIRPQGDHAQERRSWIAAVKLVLAVTLVLAVGFQAGIALAGLPIEHDLVRAVDCVGMSVADMDRSVAFYSKVLDFEKVCDVEVAGSEYEQLQGVFGLRMRVVRMRLGDESVELTEYLAPKGRLMPVDSRSNDHWFQHIAIITSDMDRAYQWLRKNKVEHASTGPQRLPDWNKNAGGIEAFYFKDPDGHPLEILHFPSDKGDLKWQRLASQSPEKLFLGIDHTAIVVADTDASLKFYRDTLGLKIAGESENYGTEQEHLNNVFGARLRITALRAASGPGVELLEYLAPRDGRVRPPDSKANDLMHWETRVVASGVETAARSLRAAKATFVSSGVIVTASGAGVPDRRVVVRDPDGHAIHLTEFPRKD